MIEDFYGDNVRWFLARVVNRQDPDESGRVQIRIYGIHTSNETDVPTESLPWAQVLLPSTEGGVSGLNRIPQLIPPALVFGIFLDGKTSQSPLVLGSLPYVQVPSTVQTNRFREYNRSFLGTDGTKVAPELKSFYREGNADINQRRLIIMKYFVDNGFSANVAAGITGNLEGENSSFEPRFSVSQSTFIDAGQREQSFGLAQWNKAAGRFQKLLRYASRVQKDPEDFFVQLDFILHELRGKRVDDDGGSSYSGAYDKLLLCDRYKGGVSNSNATWIFCRYYENPRDPESKLPTREQYAQIAYDQYQNAVTSANVV